MEKRYVNGSNNGEYHTFDKNNSITIDGDLTYSATSWQVAEADPLDVLVVLYREKFGSDKKIGSYTIPSPDAESEEVTTLFKDFSKKLGTADKKSGKYYLEFSKPQDDGWDITGSGKLSN